MNAFIGSFPTHWVKDPMRFPQRTPGSLFQAIVTRRVGYGKTVCGHTYRPVKGSLEYDELEFWYTDSTTKTGRAIWRKHQPLNPDRLP